MRLIEGPQLALKVTLVAGLLRHMKSHDLNKSATLDLPSWIALFSQKVKGTNYACSRKLEKKNNSVKQDEIQFGLTCMLMAM